MKIRIHAVGKRMPAWIRVGFEGYQSRFPEYIRLSLREINMPSRTSGVDVLQLKDAEGEKLLAGIGADDIVIALDESGQQWTSRELAYQLGEWVEDKRNVSLLVGGPDGLSRVCMDKADFIWALSKMTLPHMMVRVVLVEQLYRAWAITRNHPYHRD